MARSRRSRRYYKRSSGRWSSNIRNIETEQTIPPNSTFFNIAVLCNNPSQNDNTVSQKYTVKNIEYTYQIENRDSGGTSSIENLSSYIMYVPEGMIVTETYPFNHPEYIMAYRYQGSCYGDSSTIVLPKIRTRLARTLNTGDRIVCLTIGSNTQTTGNIPVDIRGLVRWCTKAN